MWKERILFNKHSVQFSVGSKLDYIEMSGSEILPTHVQTHFQK